MNKKAMGLVLMMGLWAQMGWPEENRLETDLSLLMPINIIQNQDTNLLGIENDMYPNSTLYSVSLNSEQSSKKTKKKGRIIGTLIGAGIGGGLGYWVYQFSYDPELKEHRNDLALTTAVSTIGGGIIGYQIGGSEKRKGKIIGTIIGIGIGGGIGFVLYVMSAFGIDVPPREASSLALIIPTVVGGIIGCDIGDHYDKKTLNKKKR
jgi:hypothetical protein